MQIFSIFSSFLLLNYLHPTQQAIELSSILRTIDFTPNWK